MARSTDTHASPRPITLTNSEGTTAAGALIDSDGLKTAVATSTSPATYSGAALNGASANPGPALFDPPRYAKIATSAQASTYNVTSPIVISGFYGTAAGQRVAVTESIQPTAAGGNETLIGNQPFDEITSIAVPAQQGSSGQFTFGVTGVGCKTVNGERQPYRGVRANGAGDIVGGYKSHAPAASHKDTTPFSANELQPIEPYRIYSEGTTAALKLTIYE